MEFDERPDPAQPFVVRSEAGRVIAGAFHGLGQRNAVRVAQRMGLLGGEPTGAEAGADAGEPEPCALFVTEVGDRQRLDELHSPAAQFIKRGKRGDDSERTVEGSPVRDGVQVGAGDDGVRAEWITEPGPLVSIAVEFIGQTTGLDLCAEPRPAVGVGPGPGVAAVAAASRVAPEWSQLPPHLLEGGGMAPGPVTDRARGTCSPARPGPRTGPLHSGRLHAGRLHAGRLHAGRLDAGRLHAGPLDAGPLRSGRLHSGRLHPGRLHSGRLHSGRLHSGRFHAGRLRSGGGTVAHPRRGGWGRGGRHRLGSRRTAADHTGFPPRPGLRMRSFMKGHAEPPSCEPPSCAPCSRDGAGSVPAESPSRIGMRTPRSAATVSAMS